MLTTHPTSNGQQKLMVRKAWAQPVGCKMNTLAQKGQIHTTIGNPASHHLAKATQRGNSYFGFQPAGVTQPVAVNVPKRGATITVLSDCARTLCSNIA